MIVTHEMALRSKVLWGKERIVIDESARAMADPIVTCRRQDLAELAAALRIAAERNAELTPLAEAAATALEAAEGQTSPGRQAVNLDAIPRARQEKGFFRRLFAALRDDAAGKHWSDPMRCILRLVAMNRGQETRAHWDLSEYRGAHVLTVHYPIIAEASSTAIFLDAECLGNPPPGLTDITPCGSLAYQHEVKQIPIAFHMKDDPEAARRELLSHFATLPHDARIGLITFAGYLEAWRKLPAPWLGFNVTMTAHWGSGLDASSNAWTEECSHLVILGTPAVDEATIRARLGDAAPTTSAFGPRRWTRDGRTVQCYGYTDPAWRAVADAFAIGATLNAIGRGRATLPHGIPVHVFSDLPLPGVGFYDGRRVAFDAALGLGLVLLYAAIRNGVLRLPLFGQKGAGDGEPGGTEQATTSLYSLYKLVVACSGTGGRGADRAANRVFASALSAGLIVRRRRGLYEAVYDLPAPAEADDLLTGARMAAEDWPGEGNGGDRDGWDRDGGRADDDGTAKTTPGSAATAQQGLSLEPLEPLVDGSCGAPATSADPEGAWNDAAAQGEPGFGPAPADEELLTLYRDRDHGLFGKRVWRPASWRPPKRAPAG